MKITSYNDRNHKNNWWLPIIKEISFADFKASEVTLIYGNPFLRPSIFEISLKHLYKNRKLVILASYDNRNKIQSVLPCYRGETRHYGFRIKYFHGFPNRLGMFADILSTEENKANAFVDFMQYIIDNGSWDKAELLNIPYLQASILHEWLLKQNLIVSFNRSYVRIAQKANSFEEYIKHQAKYKEIRYYRSLCRKYLERTDPVIFKVFYDDTILDSIFDIANNSWKASLETNIGHPEMKPYISELIKHYSSIKKLRICLLFHQDRPIAYILCAIFNACCYFIKADYIEAYKTWNAGNVLWYYTMKYMHENETGVSSFNFLSNYPYLKKWTNQTAEYATVTIFRKNFKGRMYFILFYKFKPFIIAYLKRLRLKLTKDKT